MDRDNSTWLAHLRGDGAVQQAALADLRAALLRGLRRALAHRIPADDAFLEDAVQETLLRILERLAQFQGRSRFLTWATAIAIHLAMTDLRRRRWKDVSLGDLTDESPEAANLVVDEQSAPEIQWERTALYETLHRLIETDLSDRQRMALLAELKGVPLEVIAGQLGSNRNAIYKLTHDARKRLKRGLAAAGFESETVHAALLK